MSSENVDGSKERSRKKFQEEAFMKQKNAKNVKEEALLNVNESTGRRQRKWFIVSKTRITFPKRREKQESRY